MKIEKAWTLPASVDQVFTMLTDTEFCNHVARCTGARTYAVTVHEDAQCPTTTIERAMPADEVPEAMRKFVGESINVTETHTWQPTEADGSRTAVLALDMSGLPVDFNGHITIDPQAPQISVVSVTGELRAQVPLIGGRIERAAAPPLRSALETEARESLNWLQGGRS